MHRLRDLGNDAGPAAIRRLPSAATPSIDDVRRLSIGRHRPTIQALAVLVLAFAVVSGAIDAIRPAHWSAAAIGAAVLAVGGGAVFASAQSEVRRLQRMLYDERVLTAALSTRLHEISAMAAAAKSVHMVLSLDEVVRVILDSTLDLFEGSGGSVMLAENPGELEAVCVRGDEIPVGHRLRVGQGTVAGQVAFEREPLLLVDDSSSAMSVPLVNRAELLGIINVTAARGKHFTEYDLRSLTLFADHAATALVNARLFGAERTHVADLALATRTRRTKAAT